MIHLTPLIIDQIHTASILLTVLMIILFGLSVTYMAVNVVGFHNINFISVFFVILTFLLLILFTSITALTPALPYSEQEQCHDH